MKLSEVIKAIEDGSNSDFKNGLLKLKNCELLRSVELDSNYVGGLAITLDGWEEIKLPRQWSEKELMLFKVFHWAKWLSRERNGDILLSETKPEYVYDATENYAHWEIQDSEEKFATISTENYEDVTTATFEESPIYIGDMKGE